MNVFGCGELAEVIDGRLELGVLPPLGGRLEPVGHVTTRCEDVAAGSLYWAIEPDHPAESTRWQVQEAFFRGAKGVVVGQALASTACPVDGGFVIVVDDAVEALCRLGRWQRTAYEGKLVLVGPFLSADSVAQKLRLLCNCTVDSAAAREPVDRFVGEAISGIGSAAAALLTLKCAEITVWQLDEAGLAEIDQISHLCCPHVVCIYTIACGEQRIVDGPRTADPQATDPHATCLDEGSLLLVDSQQQRATLGERELLAKRLEPNVFDFGGARVNIPTEHLSVGLACWGVAEATGLSLNRDAWQLFAPQ